MQHSYCAFSMLLLMALLPRATADTVFISSTDCTFQYSLPNFTLASCTFPQGSSAQWDSCLARCCPKLTRNEYPNATFNALVICQTKGSASDSSVAVIVMAVAVSFFSLVVLLCLLMVLIKIIKGSFESRVAPDEDQSIEWDSPEQLTQDITQINWHAASKEQHVCMRDSQHVCMMDSQCSICLEDSCYAQLICQHLYHPSCIAAWLNKSNFCPLCHRDNIRALKLYCPTCQKRYFLIRKKLLAQHLQTIERECNVCSRHEASKTSLDQFEHAPFPHSQNLIFEHDQSEIEMGEIMDR